MDCKSESNRFNSASLKQETKSRVKYKSGYAYPVVVEQFFMKRKKKKKVMLKIEV